MGTQIKGSYTKILKDFKDSYSSVHLKGRCLSCSDNVEIHSQILDILDIYEFKNKLYHILLCRKCSKLLKDIESITNDKVCIETLCEVVQSNLSYLDNFEKLIGIYKSKVEGIK